MGSKEVGWVGGRAGLSLLEEFCIHLRLVRRLAERLKLINLSVVCYTMVVQ